MKSSPLTSLFLCAFLRAFLFRPHFFLVPFFPPSHPARREGELACRHYAVHNFPSAFAPVTEIFFPIHLPGPSCADPPFPIIYLISEARFLRAAAPFSSPQGFLCSRQPFYSVSFFTRGVLCPGSPSARHISGLPPVCSWRSSIVCF